MTDTPDEKSILKGRDTASVRATIKDGIPHYMGFTGERLLNAITITATLGGYYF